MAILLGVIHPRPSRWRRRRTAAILAIVLVVCAGAVALRGATTGTHETAAEPRLPTAVNAPGAWSDDVNRPGPVAAVGVAQRRIPVGLVGERAELTAFSTSALDGRSTWLRLPGLNPRASGGTDSLAVSPDGRWIGWLRTTSREAVAGWSIRDMTTGAVRHLEVEGRARPRHPMSELAFSGDSRHLLTSVDASRLVAWDVHDGEPVVVEESGQRSLPLLGHADRGVVWSRGNEVHRLDPRTGDRRTVTLPRDALRASWGPRDRGFAYIGTESTASATEAPQEHLLVGASPAAARRVVDLPDTSPIGESLAWRDPTHVVVGNYRGAVYEVDVTDGSHVTIDLLGSGDQLNPPRLATGLFAASLRPPAAPTGASDPRWPWRGMGVVLLLALLAGGWSVLRRADRPGPEQPEGEPLPRLATAMAWLFLAGQVAHLLIRGPNPAGPVSVAVSMLLSAVVVRWFADGVLRAHTARSVIVWVLLSVAATLTLVGLADGASGTTAPALVSLGFCLTQLGCLAAFWTTPYARGRRAHPDAPRADLTALLWIAVVTGLLGGLTAPSVLLS